MKHDNPRNFTVRFLDSALRRVESTGKAFYGGRLSTGEAIRRLAEERLDEIENSSPQESSQQALLRFVAAWRSGQILPLSDFQWLAQAVNDAYQRCKRDFVSKELLIANVSAFQEAVQLVSRGKAKTMEPEDRYYLGNLGTSKSIDAKTLPEYVDKWIARLSDQPSPAQAEFASRNLLTYLRDMEFADEKSLGKTLAAYVPSLLQVAIRGYWEVQRIPLAERVKGAEPEADRIMTPVSVGNITVNASARQDRVSLAIHLTEQCSFVNVRHFVELEDLAQITRLASAGEEASTGSFEWLLTQGPKTYLLCCDRARWQLTPKDFESFAEALEALYRTPWMAALVERAVYAYGRI
jgi:hypothetical protein